MPYPCWCPWFGAAAGIFVLLWHGRPTAQPPLSVLPWVWDKHLCYPYVPLPSVFPSSHRSAWRCFSQDTAGSPAGLCLPELSPFIFLSSPDAAIQFLERVGTDLGLASQKVEVSAAAPALLPLCLSPSQPGRGAVPSPPPRRGAGGAFPAAPNPPLTPVLP